MPHRYRTQRSRLRGPSPALKALGRQIEAEYGIQPLGPGERRPDGYYLVDHFTGRSPFPPGTIEIGGRIIVPKRHRGSGRWERLLAIFGLGATYLVNGRLSRTTMRGKTPVCRSSVLTVKVPGDKREDRIALREVARG
jgi:hypothetical protein